MYLHETLVNNEQILTDMFGGQQHRVDGSTLDRGRGPGSRALVVSTENGALAVLFSVLSAIGRHCWVSPAC